VFPCYEQTLANIKSTPASKPILRTESHFHTSRRSAVTKPSSVGRIRPSDFLLFGHLKKRLVGMRLAIHANVKQAVTPPPPPPPPSSLLFSPPFGTLKKPRGGMRIKKPPNRKKASPPPPPQLHTFGT